MGRNRAQQEAAPSPVYTRQVPPVVSAQPQRMQAVPPQPPSRPSIISGPPPNRPLPASPEEEMYEAIPGDHYDAVTYLAPRPSIGECGHEARGAAAAVTAVAAVGCHC